VLKQPRDRLEHRREVHRAPTASFRSGSAESGKLHYRGAGERPEPPQELVGEERPVRQRDRGQDSGRLDDDVGEPET
jgi:hypothetical protein